VSVYLFFDESGNLDFTKNGSRFLVFGVLSTEHPAPLTAALASLRYELLGGGMAAECFHATEDRQAVRDRVFATICAEGGFELDFLVLEKAELSELGSAPDPAVVYPHFAKELIRVVLDRRVTEGGEVVIVTDRLPLLSKKRAIEKSFKVGLRELVREGGRFTIVHHPSAAHQLLQAADYCTWAVQRKHSVGDVRSWKLVEPFVRTEYSPGGVWLPEL
jgi:hypothetical protein